MIRSSIRRVTRGGGGRGILCLFSENSPALKNSWLRAGACSNVSNADGEWFQPLISADNISMFVIQDANDRFKSVIYCLLNLNLFQVRCQF